MASLFVLLAVIALGLMAGALLAEGAILLPFWRSLPADSFLTWYRENGNLLLRFFGPLEIIAALLIILAAGLCWRSGDPAAPFLAVSGLLSLLVLASFPLYFKHANAKFAEGKIECDHVAVELQRFARWHWVRVANSMGAFLAAILAMT